MAEILFLDQYAGLGGGQRILMDLCRAFRAEGHGVRAMLPGEGVARTALEREGFEVLDLPLPAMTPGVKPTGEKLAYPFHARRAAAAVRGALAGRRTDLLYANAPRCFLPAVLAASKAHVPVACGLHLIFEGGLEHRLIRWCFGRDEVRRVIFCSGAVARPFADLCGAKGRKLHYWVSPPFLEIQKDRAGGRAALGLHGRDVAVGMLGRVSRTKGQALFLEALSPLLAVHPGLKLVVGGGADFEDPGEMERLEAVAASAPDPSRVLLTRRMVDPMPFLDAMDLLVVPSLWEEPFGLVAVEGMARSLPVVVTESGGLVEIVENGVTGFHCAKDAGALRDAVRPLVEDASLRSRMGEAGRARVEQAFHPSVQIAALMGAVL